MTEAALHIRIASQIRVRLAQVGGATVALTLIGLMTRAITVITQILIARHFGTTAASDAFFATEIIPDVFVNLLASGLGMVFIPIYAEYRVQSGDEEAWRFASAFLVGSTLLSVLFAGCILIGAPLLISLIAPGFDGEARAMAIHLMRIMAISMLLLGLNAGLRGLLQSNRNFLAPDLARFVYTCVLCVAAWLFSGRFGIYSLGWGIVVGVGLQFGLQLLSATRQKLLHPEWTLDHPGARRAGRQLLPLVVAISWTSVMFVLDRMAASGMAEGSIAAINYANRMIMLPVGIFAIPLQTTLYPTLAQPGRSRQSQTACRHDADRHPRPALRDHACLCGSVDPECAAHSAAV
ncbi:MAG: hypothetical protein HC802_04595 [Caldilineaceae bacterium]|nr:hypothetical protein [Caldilineaceae bacterium]